MVRTENFIFLFNQPINDTDLWGVFGEDGDYTFSDTDAPHIFEDTIKEYFESFARMIVYIYEQDTLELVGAAYLVGNCYHGNIVSSKRKQHFRRAKELAHTCCKIFRDSFSLHRLESICRTDNKQAKYFLNHTGFIDEGIIRQFQPHKGIWKDYYFMSMVGEELQGI